MMLLELEHRGHDASGYVSFDADWQASLYKRDEPARRFIWTRPNVPGTPRAILCHTRLATQGKAEDWSNNHPVLYDGVYVTHNGHIWNDIEVFQSLGCKRLAQVDSEAIPALLASCAWSDSITALERLDGDFAIAAASEANPGELILARGTNSPLYVHETAQYVAWASTPDALCQAWRVSIGTPPRPERIKATREGTILRLTAEGTARATFAPMERWTYQSKALDKRDAWFASTSYHHGGIKYVQCMDCFTYCPDDECLIDPDDGLRVCKSCAGYSAIVPMIEDEPYRDKCEYCGARSTMLNDTEGVYVGAQWICDICISELMDDELEALCA
jgi:asparagine synthetase B (glutamine-hydrolysing)